MNAHLHLHNSNVLWLQNCELWSSVDYETVKFRNQNTLTLWKWIKSKWTCYNVLWKNTHFEKKIILWAVFDEKLLSNRSTICTQTTTGEKFSINCLFCVWNIRTGHVLHRLAKKNCFLFFKYFFSFMTIEYFLKSLFFMLNKIKNEPNYELLKIVNLTRCAVAPNLSNSIMFISWTVIAIKIIRYDERRITVCYLSKMKGVPSIDKLGCATDALLSIFAALLSLLIVYDWSCNGCCSCYQFINNTNFMTP